MPHAVVTMFVVVWWEARRQGRQSKGAACYRRDDTFVSLLWLLNSSVVWFCAVQVYSGFAWAGFQPVRQYCYIWMRRRSKTAPGI